MATMTKFFSFSEALAEKAHNLGSDQLKVCLTNSAPLTSNTVYANITDLSTSGGYTAGGNAVTTSSSAQTSGTYKLVLADTVFTATTGFGPFRYVVLYNDTAASKELIGFYDYGSSISLGASETFTVDFDGSAGVLTLA